MNNKEELINRLKTLEDKYTLVKQRAAKYIQKNQELRLLHSCKNNAKRKSTEFTIQIEDIIIPEKCPYLGYNLTNTSNQGRVYSNASIDRIDSNKGYTKENIQIISDLANRMKQKASDKQLITFAKGVLKIHAGIDIDKILIGFKQV